MTVAAPNPPTAMKMFTIALKVGTLSFGGGLSGWIYREFVTRNGWVSETDFLADMAAARILPGTNAANITALLGYRLLGLPGATAGLAGIMIGPFSLLAAIFYLYDRIQGPALDAALQGAAAGAIGPVSYVMVKSVQHGGREWYGLLVLAGTAAASIFKLPLLLIVCLALCISFILVRTFWKP
jgi:chromate transporter